MTHPDVSSTNGERRNGSGPTPGPWIAIQGIDDDPTRWGIYTKDPRQYHVATIENGAPGDTLDTETLNARLVAAAPDLLQALKVLMHEKIDYMRMNNLGNAELTSSVAQALAALAKAEGTP